ncbi:MAG TPA: alpha/beta fold hydrolase [Burkholderiales bacterium]|nr:alpha/beta fold hydrolase [Burkholderiales bacterium]
MAGDDSGMTALVLLPGMDGTGLLLEDFVASMGANADVVLMRYPCDEPLGYPELETNVRARLPQDRPFVLLGESFSGPIAISIAATPPANMRGLILTCTFARIPTWRGFRALARFLPPINMPIVRLVRRRLLGPKDSPKFRTLLDRASAQLAPAARKARLCAVLDVDVTDRLSRIAMPVLYLRASQDLVIPRAASESLLQHLPHMRIEEFPAPHALLQTMPDEAGRVIERFMADCDNAVRI